MIDKRLLGPSVLMGGLPLLFLGPLGQAMYAGNARAFDAYLKGDNPVQAYVEGYTSSLGVLGAGNLFMMQNLGKIRKNE